MADKKLIDLPLVSATKTDEIYAVENSTTDIRVKLGDIIVDRVKAPVNMSPVDDATGFAIRGTLVGSAYNPLYHVDARTHRQFQVTVTSDVNFVSPIIDVTVDSDSYTITTALNVTTGYIWRCRDVSELGDVSAWSVATDFVTKSGEVNTPSVVSPVNGGVNVSSKKVSSSAFSYVGTSDTLSGSYWEFYVSGELVHSSDLVSGISYNYSDMQLLTTYSVRVKHVGTNYGESEWSSLVTFTTGSEWPQVIGLVQLSTTGGGTSDFQRVDKDFNPVSSFDFNSHPTYSGIVDEIIDGQYMVKIPKFYYKAGTVPSGTYSGKVYWMISSVPETGFSVHPAFLGAGGVELDQIWVGKYQASTSGGKLQSIPGVLPRVSVTFPVIRGEAYARNTGGVTGFRLWTYYDLAAIEFLSTIEIGGMDTQTLIGQGRVSTSSAANVDAADVAQATWRGIVGLWGNVWQWCDGVKRRGTWQKWQYNIPPTTTTTDLTTGYVNTGISAPTTSNNYWGTLDATMLSQGLILPASTSAVASSSTSDYFFTTTTTTTDYPFATGGSWNYGAGAGVFDLASNTVSSDSGTHLGGGWRVFSGSCVVAHSKCEPSSHCVQPYNITQKFKGILKQNG